MTDKPNLIQRQLAIMADVASLAKDSRNDDQRYDYVSSAAVLGPLREAMIRHGVWARMDLHHESERQYTTKSGATWTVARYKAVMTFINADDPAEREEITWVAEGADNSDKAANKAATAAEKYCLLKQYHIPTTDADSDGDAVPETTGAKPKGKPGGGSEPNLEGMRKAIWAISYDAWRGEMSNGERAKLLREFAAYNHLPEDTRQMDVSQLKTMIDALKAYVEKGKVDDDLQF